MSEPRVLDEWGEGKNAWRVLDLPYSIQPPVSKRLLYWKDRAEKAEAEVAEDVGVVAVWRRRTNEAEAKIADLEAEIKELRTELAWSRMGFPES